MHRSGETSRPRGKFLKAGLLEESLKKKQNEQASKSSKEGIRVQSEGHAEGLPKGEKEGEQEEREFWKTLRNDQKLKNRCRPMRNESKNIIEMNISEHHYKRKGGELWVFSYRIPQKERKSSIGKTYQAI